MNRVQQQVGCACIAAEEETQRRRYHNCRSNRCSTVSKNHGKMGEEDEERKEGEEGEERKEGEEGEERKEAQERKETQEREERKEKHRESAHC